jgi:hypothetical protein
VVSGQEILAVIGSWDKTLRLSPPVGMRRMQVAGFRREKIRRTGFSIE